VKDGAARFSPVGGIAFGIGLAGTLDEVVLHQILHWHHLYDRSTPGLALVWDGIFHLASTLLLLVGGWAIVRARSEREPVALRRVAGLVMIGAGGFNLYDGTIQHKVLRLHQVRYGVDPLPYDAVFIGVAATVLVAGVALTVRTAPGRQADVGPPQS
jgi:uncharacterized membrane protein